MMTNRHPPELLDTQEPKSPDNENSRLTLRVAKGYSRHEDGLIAMHVVATTEHLRFEALHR